MRTVLFVAPFLLDATLKFVQAAAAVPGVRLVVITQDEPEKVPAGAQHWKVSDATRTDTIVDAARQIIARTGARIDKGGNIGGVGSTGRSTAPHVHYEIWHDNVVKNPNNFIEAGRNVL